MRLAEEGRDEREEQQHDQPRRVDDEAGREARDRHDVLGLAEQLAHQRHAPAGLAARALELVLELAVLEVLEVERRGMLHQPDAGGVGDALGEQGVERARRRGRARRTATASANSSGEQQGQPVERARSASQSPSVAGRSGVCASSTTSSMISLPT